MSQASAEIPAVTFRDKDPTLVFPIEEVEKGSWLIPNNFFAKPRKGAFESVQDFQISTGQSVHVDFSQVTDWTNFLSLNDRSIELANELYRCAQGLGSQMRKIYRDRKTCADFQDNLDLFRQQVLVFLSSEPRPNLSMKELVNCEEVDGQSPPYRELFCGHASGSFIWLLDLTLLGPGDSMTSIEWSPRGIEREVKIANSSSEVLESIAWPRLNPLLVQVLLETVAIGFLLPNNSLFSEYALIFNEPTVSLWGLIHNLSLPPMDSEKKWEEFARMDRASQSTTESIKSGKISQFREDEQEQMMIQRQLASMAALQILHLNAVFGDHEPTQWGLWPAQSFKMVNVLASQFSQIPSEGRPQVADQFLLWMTLSFPELPVKGGWHTKHRLLEASTIDSLAEVGAWRKLWQDTAKEEKKNKEIKRETFYWLSND